MKSTTYLCAVLLLMVAACSSPSKNNENNPIVIDEDMGANNNTADMQFLDVNNGLSDVSNNDGCQAQGCPDTQVCNMQTGVCVDCLTNAECGANGTCDPVSNKCACDAAYHLCDGACVSNSAIETCGSSCDPCPTSPDGTTTCDGTSCDLTCLDGFVLDSATLTCVGCIGNADCTDPTTSTCGAAMTCEPCTDAAGCAHLTGTPICDDGTCVECSAADDSACGANSCDPATGTCTSTPKASVDQCEPCVADSECMTDFACVPMQFQGTDRATGFCLPVDNGGCSAPLPVSVTRTSLSGVSGDYCTLNEALTTCEGMLDYNTPNCTDASDCGNPNLDDALCEPIDFDVAHCTIGCDASEQCPSLSIGCGLGGAWCGSY